MKSTSFFKRTPVKIALLTLAFIVIGLLGFLPLWIVQHMYQALAIRVIIAVAGVVWGIGTVVGLWVWTDYNGMWKTWRKEIRKKKMNQGYESNDEYMKLRDKYPISVKHHELHYRKHHPHMSSKEIISKALAISDEEWAEREEFHRRNHEERKKYKENKPPALYRDGSDKGQRL